MMLYQISYDFKNPYDPPSEFWESLEVIGEVFKLFDGCILLGTEIILDNYIREKITPFFNQLDQFTLTRWYKDYCRGKLAEDKKSRDFIRKWILPDPVISAMEMLAYKTKT